MDTSYVFLADGFEEIEALSVVDVLRRAGMAVYTVSVMNDKRVSGAHGIVVEADTMLSDVDFENAEWLILPGGMPGATNLAECEELTNHLMAHNAAGKRIAAICAAPAVVLAPLGILDGKAATCYPGFESAFVNTEKRAEDVVLSKNVLTASGPARALDFALSIVTYELGMRKAEDVSEAMLLYKSHKTEYFF